jgi:hypothetical protein
MVLSRQARVFGQTNVCGRATIVKGYLHRSALSRQAETDVPRSEPASGDVACQAWLA